MRWFSPIPVVLMMGCHEPETLLKAASFATPWESSIPGNDRVSGSFFAVLDSEQPGTGQFQIGEDVGADSARATLHDVGGTWPVVQIRILDYDAGWRVLDLDVALNHWVAGEVALDGTAAVGVLTQNGTVRYLLDGTLNITLAGSRSGERVAGTFTDVVLSEPQ